MNFSQPLGMTFRVYSMKTTALFWHVEIDDHDNHDDLPVKKMTFHGPY